MSPSSSKPRKVKDHKEEDAQLDDALDVETSSPVKIILIDHRSPQSLNARPVSPLPLEEEESSLKPGGTTTITSVSNNTSDTLISSPLKLNEPQTFLLFIQIFSLYLARTPAATPTVKHRFRAIVRHCTAENRRRNPAYAPLAVVIYQKLRQEMDPTLWNNSLRILQGYCQRQGIQLYRSFAG